MKEIILQKKILKKLEDENLIAFKYCDKNGEIDSKILIQMDLQIILLVFK